MKFSIRVEDITKAVQKIKSLSEDTKNVAGVLLDIHSDKLHICYSDGKSSLIEIIDILEKSEDTSTRIIVSFKKLLDTLDICQPSGSVKTKEMFISIEDNKTLSVKVDKYLDVWYTDENDETVSEQKIVSTFKTDMPYNYAEDSIKFGILTRMDYESIFRKEETADEWDRALLRDILLKVSSEKGRTVYVSSKLQAVTVVNLAKVVYEPLENTIYQGFAISTKMAKSIADILGKMTSDKVNIISYDRYVCLTDTEDTVGIWFEMVAGSKTDLATLQQYTAKDYTKLQLVFSRSALHNVLSCALSLNKEEKSTLTFNVDTSVSLIVSSNNGSSKDTFNVVAEGDIKDIGDLEVLKSTSIPINLRLLMDMVKDCISDYIALDIDINQDSKFIRVGSLLGRDTEGNKIVWTKVYTTSR